MTKSNPFRYFKTSPEIIRLTVMLYTNEIKKRRIQWMKSSTWKWHLDEVFVKTNGEMYYLWRDVDHDGEVLENYVTKRRGRKAALKFLRN